MSFCAFAQLVTTFIFFSAWDKSRVKWDNSQNSTQKMRTFVHLIQERNYCREDFVVRGVIKDIINEVGIFLKAFQHLSMWFYVQRGSSADTMGTKLFLKMNLLWWKLLEIFFSIKKFQIILWNCLGQRREQAFSIKCCTQYWLYKEWKVNSSMNQVPDHCTVPAILELRRSCGKIDQQ